MKGGFETRPYVARKGRGMGPRMREDDGRCVLTGGAVGGNSGMGRRNNGLGLGAGDGRFANLPYGMGCKIGVNRRG